MLHLALLARPRVGCCRKHGKKEQRWGERRKGKFKPLQPLLNITDTNWTVSIRAGLSFSTWVASDLGDHGQGLTCLQARNEESKIMERDTAGRIFASAILSLPMSQIITENNFAGPPNQHWNSEPGKKQQELVNSEKKEILPNGFVNVMSGKHNEHTAREQKGF